MWRLAWERDPAGRYHAWVVDVPTVRVSGDRWSDVSEELYHRIDDELQAGEWTGDWFPPQPFDADNRCWVDPTFVVLVGEGRHDAFSGWNSLYEGSVCPACGSPKGSRNRSPLTTHISIGAGICFSWHGHPDIMRAETVKALSHDRLGGAEILGVERIGRGCGKYVELAPRVIVPHVALAAPVTYNGWKCGQCEGRAFSHVFGQDYVNLVAASSVPGDAESFWVDRLRPRLCVRQEWWAAHRFTRAMRGVIANALVVVRDDAIESNPALRVSGHWPKTSRSHKAYLANYAKLSKLKLPAHALDWLRAGNDA